MKFHTQHLRRGGTLSLSSADDESLTIVYGEGGGCTLSASNGAAAIWVPLCGFLQVNASTFAYPARTGEALVTEQDPRIKTVGHARAQWVALLGGKKTWRQILGHMQSGPSPDAQLLPARHSANRDLRRCAISLARATSVASLESATNGLIDGVLALQAPLYDAVARCPGRTHATRLQVFLRLQRVRNFISVNCDQDLDNDVLARMANYSPCHFLRTFSLAFQETPHSYLVTQRLQRACRLLHSSDLAVSEVALASGFENRSAFSRLFHRRFGATAHETRRKASAAA